MRCFSLVAIVSFSLMAAPVSAQTLQDSHTQNSEAPLTQAGGAGEEVQQGKSFSQASQIKTSPRASSATPASPALGFPRQNAIWYEEIREPIGLGVSPAVEMAQVPNPVDPIPQKLPDPQLLPPPTQFLQPPVAPTPPSQLLPDRIPGTITVDRFEVIGSTVFSPEELAAVTAPF